MIRFYLVTTIILFGIPVGHAQKATQEALQLACACFEGTPLEDLVEQQLTTRIDSCLGEGLYVNLTGVLREQGASLDRDSSMYRLAQYLQQQLTQRCASFRQVTKALANNQLEEVKVKNQRTEGVFYQFNTNQQFPIFVLLTFENELEDFLWLHEFDGSTRFMQGIKPFLYTKVEIVWREVELYDRLTNSYAIYREILLIEEKEEIDKKERKAWIKAYERTLKRKD